MPDTHFNAANLKDHFRRFGVIYIIGIVAAAVLCNLLWTTTAPRVPGSQSVLIYMADSYSDGEAMKDIADDMLVRCREYDAALRQVTFESLLFTDPNTDYTSMMVLLARLSAGEGDAFLASQNAMDTLANSAALIALDEYVAQGWLQEYGLEPYYVTVEDPETGEADTYCAGLRLDPLDALVRREAFNNKGAFLALAANSENPETTMKALEIMVEDLTREAKAND